LLDASCIQSRAPFYLLCAAQLSCHEASIQSLALCFRPSRTYSHLNKMATIEMQEKGSIASARSYNNDDILPSPRRPLTEGSRYSSGRSSPSGFNLPGTGTKRYFHSRRIDPKDIVKPWAEKKDSSKKWHTIIPLMGIFVGLGLAALECWQGYTSVVNKSYCLVYDEDFSSGTLDSNIWTKEVGVGGFGNGQFE
jgi:hypothetical protein